MSFLAEALSRAMQSQLFNRAAQTAPSAAPAAPLASFGATPFSLASGMAPPAPAAPQEEPEQPFSLARSAGRTPRKSLFETPDLNKSPLVSIVTGR